MTQLSIQFTQPCPCGGRTSHPHNARTAAHESSKRHQRWVSQGQQTNQMNQTTQTHAVPSTSASPSVSLKEAKAS